MRRKAPAAALFSVWLIVGVAAFAQEEAPPPEIEVSGNLSFGSFCVGKSSQKAVTIINAAPKGDEEPGPTLQVTKVEKTGSGSGSFTYTGPGQFEVAAQDSRSFPVTFNASLPAGSRNATFKIFSNDPDDNPKSIPASGTVLDRRIAVSLSSVNFGEQRVGTRSPTQTLRVSNPGQDSVKVTLVKRVGPNAGEFVVAAPAVPLVIPKGNFSDITVAFQPTGAGLRKAVLEITSDSCTTPKLSVALVGTGVLPNVSVEPNPIDAGTSQVGKKSKPTAITVANDGQAALEITAIQIIGADAADFALSNLPTVPKTLQPEESFVFSIRMTPTEEGLRLASINVLSDDPDVPTFTVAVRGTATAASPSPSASASPSLTPTASPTPTGSGSPSAIRGGSSDSLAIGLVVGGVLFAFVGLIVVRRLMRTPDED